MNMSKWKKITLALLVVACLGIIFSCVIGGVIVIPWITKRAASNAGVGATYGGLTLPPSAVIIENVEGPSDFHGDRSTCMSFRVSPQDAQQLIRTQYQWMNSIDTSLPAGWEQAPCRWQAGNMDSRIRGFITGLDAHLAAPPPNSMYDYVFRWVDGGWWRLLAIDRQTNIVYYYYVTW